MFYVHADVTIQSTLQLEELAQAVARALAILPMQVDTSGKYEGDIVYASKCFGLDFELAEDEPPLSTFHLTVNSDVDAFDFSGSEKDLDGVTYVLTMLGRAGIDAAARDPKLLYG